MRAPTSRLELEQTGRLASIQTMVSRTGQAPASNRDIDPAGGLERDRSGLAARTSAADRLSRSGHRGAARTRTPGIEPGGVRWGPGERARAHWAQCNTPRSFWIP